MTVKYDIISKASDELEIVDRQIIQLPEILGEVQLNLDDLIVPASNFDRRVCELTQAVNLKVKELEVLNDLITGGCITLIGDGDGGFKPSGQVVQFDVVQGGRNDSEDTDYIGNNPFSTTVFGATTNMMGGGDFENIITGNLGVGVTTLIGVGRTFFAQESKANDNGGSPCSNGSGTFSSQRTTLLNEIATRRATRDAFMNKTVNSLKNEMKSKYTQRHSHVWGRQKSIERKAELENLISIAEDSDNASYFT